MPRRQHERRIRHKVRRAVDVNPLFSAPEESVADFGQTAVERQVMCNLHRRLRLVAIRAAAALELEASVVRDVDLLVRVVDEKGVRADCEASEAGRRAGWNYVGGGSAWIAWTSDYCASDATLDRPSGVP